MSDKAEKLHPMSENTHLIDSPIGDNAPSIAAAVSGLAALEVTTEGDQASEDEEDPETSEDEDDQETSKDEEKLASGTSHAPGAPGAPSLRDLAVQKFFEQMLHNPEEALTALSAMEPGERDSLLQAYKKFTKQYEDTHKANAKLALYVPEIIPSCDFAAWSNRYQLVDNDAHIQQIIKDFPEYKDHIHADADTGYERRDDMRFKWSFTKPENFKPSHALIFTTLTPAAHFQPGDLTLLEFGPIEYMTYKDLCISPAEYTPQFQKKFKGFHTFHRRISSQLLLYRICATFGMPPISETDEYKVCWEVELYHSDGKSVARFYDYKGAASRDFDGTDECKADYWDLMNYLAGYNCRHTYDGIIAGVQA